MSKWRLFRGEYRGSYSYCDEITCPCGRPLGVHDQDKVCPTCGREYRRQITVSLKTRGDGNGRTYVEPEDEPLAPPARWAWIYDPFEESYSYEWRGPLLIGG